MRSPDHNGPESSKGPNDIPMHTLQAADKLLGRAACLLLQPLRLLRRPPKRPRDFERVLLVKFWGIGSLQLLTPAVACLRERHPGARISLLTLNENEAFASGLGVFDEVRTLDVRATGWGSLFRRILGLFRRLRDAHYDAVYDFEFFTRFSAVVALATGARESHGFAAPGIWRGNFHSHTVPFNRYWHVARNFRALTGGEDGQDVRPVTVAPFVAPDTDREAVASLLATRGLDEERGFVVLNPNAGRLSLERRWPAPHFAELARRVAGERDLDVVFVGSGSERAYTGAIAERAGAALGQSSTPRIHDLSGALSIGQLCALFARARVVVSNDSGPMHLAAALGVPTLGLFGPETPVMYAPLGENAHFLWNPPVCSPCINVHDNKVATCIYGSPQCLVNIPVQAVADELGELLGGKILHPFEQKENAPESESARRPQSGVERA